MDKELFLSLCQNTMAPQAVKGKIGTYSEKLLHSIIKYYFDRSGEYHEKKIGRFVADIAFEDRIVEIQTRQFFKMKGKLEAFLERCPTTIVYPVALSKTLVWVDPETGEETKPRKCPSRLAEYDVFPELYSIKEFLKNKNLSVVILQIELLEKRILCGYSKDRKKGSVRLERYPAALLGEIHIDCPDDYKRFLPDEQTFTAKEFGKIFRLSAKKTQSAIHVLKYMNAIVPVSKTGNAIIYTKNI